MNYFHLLDQYCHDCANQKCGTELNGIIAKHIPWIKKIDPVDWLSGFWTKFSKRVACTSYKPQLKIPYLFSRNCANTGYSPILKSLGRSCTVNNVCLRKLLYNASPFIKIISRSNWSHRLTSVKVKYEIANNAIHAHWMNACCFPKHSISLIKLSLYYLT